MDGVEQTDDDQTPDVDPNVALLAAQREEMELSDTATGEQRKREIADLDFEQGNHWTDEDIKKRKLQHKPTFVIDHISGQIQQVTNQPVHRIVVTAVGRNADPTSAEDWQGYCRRVENLSNAEDVYKWARMHAAKMGRGFWRIRPDVFAMPEFGPGVQLDGSIFNQDLRIEAIVNQHSVYEDPRCRMLDFSDQRFCNIAEDMQWSEINRLYPRRDKVERTGDTVRATGDCPAEWATEKTGRVIERYWIDDEVLSFCMLKTGEVVLKDGNAKYPADSIAREHTFRVPKVKWLKSIAGVEVVEGPVGVPGKYIPVVKIVGERRIVDGKEDNRGMVRMAKDPARLLDFMETRLAQAVDIGTIDTWLVASESIGDSTDWDDLAAGGRPARLMFDAVDKTHPDGPRLPTPQHVSAAPVVAPIVNAATRASMNLRHVLGIPDVAPEEKVSEQSGRAINARRQQQQVATSHYADSTAAGIRLTGRIIMAMAREILDVPQVLRIMGADEKPVELVAYKGGDPQREQMAQEMMQERPAAAGQNGQAQAQAQARRMLRVDLGEFDVDVTAGKGYQSGRQETVDNLTNMIQAAPQIAPKAIPVMLKNSDWPGAMELAKALEPDPDGATVPREEAEKAQKVIDMLVEKVDGLEKQVQSNERDLQSKESIAQQDNAAKVQIEQMKADLEQQRMAFEFQLEERKIQADIDKMNAQIAADIEKANISAQAAVETARLKPEPTFAPEGGVA